MSRVYDALQQCHPDQVMPAAIEGDGGEKLFSGRFVDSAWDRDAVPSVEPDLCSEDRMPVVFSAYGLASEQFRLLASRLQQLQLARSFKSVMLTSSVAEEGKSLLTLNLAMSLAQGGQQRILVVDADVRKPGLCRTLRVDERAGIREWFVSNRPVTDFIFRITGLNVWILPGGQAVVDPLEVLKSPRMLELITSMNAAFDWVLIDSAPLLLIADAEILSRLSDGTMIVIRRDKSSKTALKQALARVPSTKMIGFLLNDFPTASAHAYEEYSAEPCQ